MSQGTPNTKQTPKKERKVASSLNSKSHSNLNTGREKRVQTSTKGGESSKNMTLDHQRTDNTYQGSTKKQNTSSTRSIENQKKSSEIRRSSDDFFMGTDFKKPIPSSSSAKKIETVKDSQSKKANPTLQGNLPPKTQSSTKFMVKLSQN